MPVSLSIDTEQRLTLTTAEGVVTDAEFIEARQQVLAHPDFDPSFDRIWDFHRVTESQVTGEVIVRLVQPSQASPADQDAMALALYNWQGKAPWGGYC